MKVAVISAGLAKHGNEVALVDIAEQNVKLINRAPMTLERLLH